MDYDYGSNGSEAIGIIIVAYLAFGFFALLLAVGVYVLMALALSSFFAKVGVERWAAWVPVYSTWKWLEVGGQPGWLALFSLLSFAGGSVVTSVFLYIGMWRSGIAFRRDSGFLVLGIFLPFVWAFILGGRDSVYQPELITRAGYPPPLAGFGSAPRPPYAPTA